MVQIDVSEIIVQLDPILISFSSHAYLPSYLVMVMGPYQRHSEFVPCTTMASPNAFAGDDSFNVLTTHVVALQTLLDSGRLTSVHLVEKYLAQIGRHNVAGMAIRALISIAPRVSLLKQASDLDVERKNRGKRGPMHGIPVIVKV
jgi:hypothetical protein